MAMSNLPRELAEEVLSRVPLTCLRSVRLICKKWNTLSKDESFTNKLIAQAKSDKDEFLAIMVTDFRVNLMSVNICGEMDTSSIKTQGKLITLNDANQQVDISQVFHCDGLLLCIPKDINNSRLVVCNPYCGQRRWIKPRKSSYYFVRYALGYEKNKNSSIRCHKILRFMYHFDLVLRARVREFEIYNVKSSSWKVLRVTPDWYTEFNGVSLKGNTYWFATNDASGARDLLICFDFTAERFAPHMHMPFQAGYYDTVALSSVREEQLAVLLQRKDLRVQIWVTTKIEPKDVTWNLFLSVDMKPIIGFQFCRAAVSFFIDHKRKVAVVFEEEKHAPISRDVMGENGYVKKVDLGESRELNYHPLACSYVPSSVKIDQPARSNKKRKRNRIKYY